MKRFDDLEFKPHKNFPDGKQAKLSFDNGYEVSVIQSEHSYGGSRGLYELAIIDEDGLLCYDTPITDDVLGWLSESDVTKIMQKVQELPAKAKI